MSTKHLYDSADGLVLKSLRGVVALNPSLGSHEPSKTVFVLPPSAPSPSAPFQRSSTTTTSPPPATPGSSSNPTTTAPTTPRRTAIIPGGGSGHEPAHPGYTGRGMLTASVAGDIFASPSAKQVMCVVFGGHSVDVVGCAG